MASAGPYRMAASLTKAAADVADAAIAEGAATFTVNGHAFEAGDPIWISKNDDTGVQFCGVVVTKDTNTLTVEYGANENKGSAAKIWTSDHWAQMSGNPARFTRTRQSGTDMVKSRGGVLYPVHAADGVDVLRFQFPAALAADYKALADFIADTLSDGIEPFTLSYWDWQEAMGVVGKAWWAGPDATVEFIREMRPVYAGWEVAFFLEAANTYI